MGPAVIGTKGLTERRSGCYTCGAENLGSREQHAQRAWAKTHARNNPGHEAYFVTTNETLYTDKEVS